MKLRVEQMLALAKQQHEQQLAAVEQAKAELDERLKQKTIAFEDLTAEISTVALSSLFLLLKHQL